jgi:ArsR family transcriptional regulator
MQSPTNKRIFRLQSEVCKILANPKRLEILHELRDGEMTVGQLVSSTGLKQANVSQYLALMRRGNMVVERREGNRVLYRIADKRISKACDIMREVLLHQAGEGSRLVQLASAVSRS